MSEQEQYIGNLTNMLSLLDGYFCSCNQLKSVMDTINGLKRRRGNDLESYCLLRRCAVESDRLKYARQLILENSQQQGCFRVVSQCLDSSSTECLRNVIQNSMAINDAV